VGCGRAQGGRQGRLNDCYASINRAAALHPQRQVWLALRDQMLPLNCGYPMKLRMPTKLGYKNPKHIVAIFVTNSNPGGYWEDQGYNWFGGS
jgi:DMSO/TMAO reductase YedYZ molybdopterin-dependent catalytic subunit